MKNNIIEQQNIELVGLTAKPFIGKMGLYRLFLFFAEFWWIEFALFLSIIAHILNVYLTDINIWIVSVVPIIVEVIGKILEMQANNRKILDWLVKPVVKKAAIVNAGKIISSMNEKEAEFKLQVLQKYFNDTERFKKYSDYLPPLDSFIQ